MKTIPFIVVAAGMCFGLAGCQTSQTSTKTQAWLDVQTAAPAMKIDGIWFSDDWGRGEFRQSGRQVTGSLDSYEVRGVVSGTMAYLTTWESGKCYYSIILTQSSPNVLAGSYTRGPTYSDDPKAQRPIELRRAY